MKSIFSSNNGLLVLELLTQIVQNNYFCGCIKLGGFTVHFSIVLGDRNEKQIVWGETSRRGEAPIS